MFSFEDYLKQLHAKGYTGTDDDMPDAFESWLALFDVNDILELVKKWEHTLHDHIDVGDSDHEDVACIPVLAI